MKNEKEKSGRKCAQEYCEIGKDKQAIICELSTALKIVDAWIIETIDDGAKDYYKTRELIGAAIAKAKGE